MATEMLTSDELQNSLSREEKMLLDIKKNADTTSKNTRSSISTVPFNANIFSPGDGSMLSSGSALDPTSSAPIITSQTSNFTIFPRSIYGESGTGIIASTVDTFKISVSLGLNFQQYLARTSFPYTGVTAFSYSVYLVLYSTNLFSSQVLLNLGTLSCTGVAANGSGAAWGFSGNASALDGTNLTIDMLDTITERSRIGIYPNFNVDPTKPTLAYTNNLLNSVDNLFAFLIMSGPIIVSSNYNFLAPTIANGDIKFILSVSSIVRGIQSNKSIIAN